MTYLETAENSQSYSSLQNNTVLILYKFHYQSFVEQSGPLGVGSRTKSSENVRLFVGEYIEAVQKSNEIPVHLAFEDGTDTGFRNVGQLQFEAGEIPRRKYTKIPKV